MTSNDLYTRAMLVHLLIESWGARKDDKQAAAETAQLYGAKPDAGKYTKRLMPKGDNAYTRLQSHVSAWRAFNLSQTLSWSDDGWRLLPVKNWQAYTDGQRKMQHTFETLLMDLERDYPALKDQAIRDATEEAQRTGNPRRLLQEGDFPKVITREYRHGLDYAPVPTGGDFRVQLSQEEIDVIAGRTEARVQAAFDAAQTDAVTRLFDVLSKIHERLTRVDNCDNCDGKGEAIETRKNENAGKKVTCWICDGKGQTNATFRDTLVTNAREVCDALTRLNVKGDARLEEYRAQTELLAKHEPETLREDVLVRVDTASKAQSILDAMRATYGAAVIA